MCGLELSVVFFELYPVTFHSLFHVRVLSFSVATYQPLAFQCGKFFSIHIGFNFKLRLCTHQNGKKLLLHPEVLIRHVYSYENISFRKGGLKSW